MELHHLILEQQHSECWLKPRVLPSAKSPIFGNTTGTGDFVIHSDGTVRIHREGGNWKDTQAGAVKVGQWTHVALVRNASNAYTLYINGKSEPISGSGDGSITGTWDFTGNMTIGKSFILMFW